MNKSEPNKSNEKGRITPPNHEYLELNFARETATWRGLNQYCIMERTRDQMKVTEGRVGVKVGPHKPRTFYRPMEEWDKIFSMKISQGHNACCKADEERRSPLVLEKCPKGYEHCTGDCFFYDEE